MSTSPMTTPSPTARASVPSNKRAGDAVEIHDGEIWMWLDGVFGNAPRQAQNEYHFRAPRHGDLVVCPYCDADTFDCDHCGDERRLYADEVFPPCDSPQVYHSDGGGGNPPSPGETRQSTKTNPTPGSSRSESSPTGSGRKALTSLLAFGGSQAKSTPRPASFSPPKSAAPKSTDAAQTHGELGHG